MSDLNSNLKEYISKIDETVANHVRSLSDVEIDTFNDAGNNGYIFFGNHKIFRSRVAVKYYYYIDNSHEEVSFMKNIRHNNILHIWDAHIVGDGWAYFVTDEITNGSLDDYMKDNFISTHKALDIIRGILSGLGKMHEAPNYLLHRDLKPANVLMDSSGNPVIADFGSIKRLPDSVQMVKASQHSALYRPPESYENGIYMIASDIYQLGLVMYQVLRGNLPYNSNEYMNKRQIKEYSETYDICDRSKYVDRVLYEKAMKGKLIDVSSLSYYTHPSLIHIIKKATNPDPVKRYLNTADFLLALHRSADIPNWTYENVDCAVCEHKSTFARIIKAKNGYLLEKSKDGSTWRKVRGAQTEATAKTVYFNAFIAPQK
jgi:serine/threonine protein kinase